MDRFIFDHVEEYPEQQQADEQAEQQSEDFARFFMPVRNRRQLDAEIARTTLRMRARMQRTPHARRIQQHRERVQRQVEQEMQQDIQQEIMQQRGSVPQEMRQELQQEMLARRIVQQREIE